MCMKNSDLEKKAKRYLELKKMIDELDYEKDELKEAMVKELKVRGKDTVKVGSYIITNKTTTRKQLDSKTLEKDLPGVYEKYLNENSYSRFGVMV